MDDDLSDEDDYKRIYLRSADYIHKCAHYLVLWSTPNTQHIFLNWVLLFLRCLVSLMRVRLPMLFFQG